MFGGHGGVFITTNLASIVYVRKSTLYLSNCRNTLTQSKQTVPLRVCLGTYQSDEESLPFLMDVAGSGGSQYGVSPDRGKCETNREKTLRPVPVMLEVAVHRDGGLRRPVLWKGRRRLTEMQAVKTSRNDVLSVFSEGSSTTPLTCRRITPYRRRDSSPRTGSPSLPPPRPGSRRPTRRPAGRTRLFQKTRPAARRLGPTLP